MSELPQKIKNYFTEDAVAVIRQAIDEAAGNELFAVGRLDDQDLIASVSVVARGSRSAVPALDRAVSPGEVVIHNHPSGDLTPSEADMRVAARLGNQGIGFLIVNNSVDNVYAVVEVIQVRAKKLEEDKAFIRTLLGPSGPIASSLPSYEYRQEQLDMADDVVEAVFAGRHAMIEAGTGTGKSLAYLVPCIVWSRRVGKRVVISTNTINLQEQLAYKDIPFLSRNLGIEFRVALMKGRANYVCLRKVENLNGDLDSYLDDDEQEQLRAVLAAITTDRAGSRSDLPMQVSAEIWERICSEPDTCLRGRCPFEQSCHYMAARREAQSADIVIANHHLLLADVAVRGALDADVDMAVLPKYDCAVFDEAHHLGDIVHEYMGDSVATTQIERTLRRLWRRPSSGASGRETGELVRLVQVLTSIEGISSLARSRAISVINSSLSQNISRALDLVSSLKAVLMSYFAHATDEEQGNSVKIKDTLLADQSFASVRGDSDKLAFVLDEIAQQLAEVHGHISPYEEELDRVESGLCQEIRALSDRCGSLATGLRSVMQPPEESFVHWIEAARNNYSFRSAPVELGDRFVDSVLGRLSGSVFTSATLTVQGSFDYFKRSLGIADLPEGRVIQRCIPSPFDFPNQVLLSVASGLPSPDSQEFYDQLPEVLWRLLIASSGRAFVLFTSHSAMRRAAAECRAELVQRGFRLFVQGEAGRHQLISDFRSDTSSILFGTDSFWEGVDVRGPSLSSVIIVKLPFRVPTEPLLQAKLEAIQTRGGDPFAELSLPEAVIRFRQGFGRLVRSREDTGVVVVLDSRIVKRRYGRAFLESIPRCTTIVGGIDEIEARIREWLDRSRT